MVPFADSLNHTNVQTKYDYNVAENGAFRMFPTGSNRYASFEQFVIRIIAKAVCIVGMVLAVKCLTHMVADQMIIYSLIMDFQCWTMNGIMYVHALFNVLLLHYCKAETSFVTSLSSLSSDHSLDVTRVVLYNVIGGVFSDDGSI